MVYTSANVVVVVIDLLLLLLLLLLFWLRVPLSDAAEMEHKASMSPLSVHPGSPLLAVLVVVVSMLRVIANEALVVPYSSHGTVALVCVRDTARCQALLVFVSRFAVANWTVTVLEYYS